MCSWGHFNDAAFFIESTLGEGQFDIAIIYLGITNLLNTTGTEGLLQNILKTAARCKTHIICKIFVSSVLHTGKVSSDMVAKLNLDIDNIVKSNSFHFVDNNNVSINYILVQKYTKIYIPSRHTSKLTGSSLNKENKELTEEKAF